MDRLFDGVRAPSTLGTFLRSFTFGHVRQLDAVASRLLINLATSAPLLGHLMASTPGTELLEYDTVDASISREFFVEPPTERDGWVSVPDTPGLGVELSDALLEKYGV